jgi:phosphoribosylaminoimidazole-succinocarboxamide synthase
MKNSKLTYRGSVKDVYEADKDTSYFVYSDRYSLFDWGEMPDHLHQKGEALAVMGALFFEIIGQHHIPHHFLNLCDEKGNTVGFKPSRTLHVKRVPIIRPEQNSFGYDYSAFLRRPGECLVPLEVMFRFGVTKGSSLIKRVTQMPHLLEQWNLDDIQINQRFVKPLIDFSTKLEKGDRYLDFSEAQKLAGLSDIEFTRLLKMTEKVAMILKRTIESMDLELWDGKIEWAFLPETNPSEGRSFMLVDSIGLDELRIEKRGHSLSKEILREFYRKTEWYEAWEQIKYHRPKFELLPSDLRPPLLSSHDRLRAEALYLSFANQLSKMAIGSEIFSPQYCLSHWEKEFLG